MALLVAMPFIVGSGGRVELIPLPQTGHLSADAVMAREAGGFVYFPQLEESGEVTLVVDLVDASTGTPFGAMRMAFSAD